MSVLIEAISVVIKADRLLESFPGGWDSFRDSITNDTLCADGELVRVGFMAPGAVEDFVLALERLGLVNLNAEGKAVDIVVVDQQRGFAASCDWAELGHIEHANYPGKYAAVCWLKNGSQEQAIFPPGWKFEESLSFNFEFVESSRELDDLMYLRTENGLRVYRNLKTGKEVYSAE